jgi:hypothetical protein
MVGGNLSRADKISANCMGHLPLMVIAGFVAALSSTIIGILLIVTNAFPAAAATRAEWFESLKVPGSSSGCCSVADCHRTKARVDVDGHWWALLQAEWWPEPRWVAVPPERVLTSPRSIDGEAYVCQTAGSRRALSPINGIAAPIDPVVRCFVPPDLGS